MKEVSININPMGFPSQFVPDAEKDTLEFGLQIGQAIQYEWFRKDNSVRGRYYERYNEYQNLRLYARGEQSTAQYKKELAIDGDLSYINLNWQNVPVIPKFVDIVVNGMSDRLFKVKAYAQDAMSQAKRSKYQDMIEGQMAAKDILEIAQSISGQDPFVMNPDELPANDEELSLYMQINYKPAIEIAQEEAVSTIFDENDFLHTRKRLDYDQTVLGVSIAKHQFLPGDGVKISYCDPANVVYSYTEDPYFKDCFYWGEIKTIPITELLKIDPSLTQEDLETISKYSQSWYDYFNVSEFYDDDIFFRDTCTVLYFNYKTAKKMVYKKKKMDTGGEKVIEKDDTFNPPEEMMEEGGFEKMEKTIDVWYDGIMVMGTNIMLKWEVMKNMVRPKSTSQHAMPNYAACAPRMYKGRVESLVRRMIPFADLIQLTHLKLQQVIARTVPDGVFIDADGLNEVDLGNGGTYNPEDALRLYFQTGSVVGRSYTQDGDFNQARIPIQELNKNSGASKTQMLIGNYNHYLDMIRTVTGLNEARDGSTPDERSLVGVQKLAALNSNTATRHILDATLFIVKRVAEGISCRVADILEYSEFKDDFANKIGKYNVSILNDIKDLYIYDFGIFLEVAPDEEQKAQLEANLQMALSKGDINLEDAIDIREIKNIKLANQLLKVKRIKKSEQLQKNEMQKQAMTAQNNAQSQQMAAQVAMQKIQMETQAKMQLKKAEATYDLEKMRGEAELKSQLMAEEFRYNLQIAAMQGKSLGDREQAKEDAKADRISQQNTEQSKLIEQRLNNLPSIVFESNEDSLDGFDLAEFSPR